MNSNVKFSNLTSDQINEVQALESKFKVSNDGQDVILIAYTTPEQS